MKFYKVLLTKTTGEIFETLRMFTEIEGAWKFFDEVQFEVFFREKGRTPIRSYKKVLVCETSEKVEHSNYKKADAGVLDVALLDSQCKVDIDSLRSLKEILQNITADDTHLGVICRAGLMVLGSANIKI